MSYGWDISRQATEKILGLPKRERDQIVYFLDRLVDDFEGMTETSFYDTSGALHHVTTIKSRAITFVVDDPVKLIHVIAIE